MDVVQEIKVRLPIEELVGQYCQLQKKGRSLVCVCPFHNDTHPSMLVSPDKGIAFCFACQSGGDIFSFYQLIEGVDFRQALKDLAEKAGVEIPDAPTPSVKKDEKDRLRDCLDETLHLYRQQLAEHQAAQAYLKNRAVDAELQKTFEIGVAPDSFSVTYEHLLKQGFSRSEIIKAGIGVQKDLQEGRIYDRFRNRLMFPIRDGQGQLVGFGGRTLGEDDAKYINSSEGPLYHKSRVMFGLHLAKEAMRDTGKVILVEGYFDVVACHKVGVTNVVAASGTALTEEHVKILKRLCDTVVLCLDQDRAGQDAAERAYFLCAKEELAVRIVALNEKDPDEAVQADPEGFATRLKEGGVDYLEYVLQTLAQTDVRSVEGKRTALQRLLPLLQAVPTEVERSHYLAKAAALFGTTETALRDDIAQHKVKQPPIPSRELAREQGQPVKKKEFTRAEIALGLVLLYPEARDYLTELIEPTDSFAANLYHALTEVEDGWTPEALPLSPEDQERVALLQLFCEHHGMLDWSDQLAVHEVRKNFRYANRATLRVKQQEILRKITEARREGRSADEQQLNNQYTEILKLTKMAL